MEPTTMTSQPYVVPSSEFDTSSIDEYDSLDDIDIASTSTFDSLQASKDYWLGKMFMRFTQACAVLRESSSAETVTECDVKLEERLRRYPYMNSLRSLQECSEAMIPPNLSINTTDDYEAFLCSIGHMITRNSKLECLEISTIFHGLQYDGENVQEQWTTSCKTNRCLDQTKNEEDPSETVLADYFDEMRRQTLQIGEPVFTKKWTEPRRQGGKHWVVSLEFRGKKYMGKASELKKALDMAAEKVCKTLDKK